jgi:hypothetical protein
VSHITIIIIKFCPCFLDNISFGVKCCNIRKFSQFFFSARKISPPARGAAASNLVCSNTDIFSMEVRFLEEILNH